MSSWRSSGLVLTRIFILQTDNEAQRKMKNIWYALNQIPKNKAHLHDIINTSNLSFKRFQKSFLTSQKQLKEKGK